MGLPRSTETTAHAGALLAASRDGKEMTRILHVVGARPNFMKIAPIISEMAKYPDDFEGMLVHTGQHYDKNMSEVFFGELGLPRPDVNLEVGSASHAKQTASIMTRFEETLADCRPDWVLVPGDVNSTVACALVATKLGVRVAHIEAGLRSFDRTMPEEINRILTDQIADLLFTPSPDGDENLLREGIPPEKIHRVGNVMIDTVVRLLPRACERWPALKTRLGLDRYVLTTLHRPSNVDREGPLREVMAALSDIARDAPVVFPVHPRTRKRLADVGIEPGPGLRLIEPISYLEFLALQENAALVITDSGGIQEETTYLGVPCLTVRPNTERPITITEGTNQLIGNSREALTAAAKQGLAGKNKRGSVPDLWDGHAAERIIGVLRNVGGR